MSPVREQKPWVSEWKLWAKLLPWVEAVGSRRKLRPLLLSLHSVPFSFQTRQPVRLVWTGKTTQFGPVFSILIQSGIVKTRLMTLKYWVYMKNLAWLRALSSQWFTFFESIFFLARIQAVVVTVGLDSSIQKPVFTRWYGRFASVQGLVHRMPELETKRIHCYSSSSARLLELLRLKVLRVKVDLSPVYGTGRG